MGERELLKLKLLSPHRPVCGLLIHHLPLHLNWWQRGPTLAPADGEICLWANQWSPLFRKPHKLSIVWVKASVNSVLEVWRSTRTISTVWYSSHWTEQNQAVFFNAFLCNTIQFRDSRTQTDERLCQKSGCSLLWPQTCPPPCWRLTTFENYWISKSMHWKLVN